MKSITAYLCAATLVVASLTSCTNKEKELINEIDAALPHYFAADSSINAYRNMKSVEVDSLQSIAAKDSIQNEKLTVAVAELKEVDSLHASHKRNIDIVDSLREGLSTGALKAEEAEKTWRACNTQFEKIAVLQTVKSLMQNETQTAGKDSSQNAK